MIAFFKASELNSDMTISISWAPNKVQCTALLEMLVGKPSQIATAIAKFSFSPVKITLFILHKY
jgi:hypothetical protein